MPTSQNGWSANDRSVLVRVAVPGGVLNVRREFAGIFEYAAIRWHEEIEPLLWPGTWSYAEKTITGGDGKTLSNHACGGACDFCAPKHPQGTDPARNFTPAQIAVIRSILAFCEGVLRWGGDYTAPTKKDGMHLEVVVGPSKAALVARVNAKCLAWLAAHRGQQPAGPGPVSGFRQIQMGEPTELGTSGEQVRKDQFDLNDSGFTLSVDGFAGPATRTRIVDFQYAAGLAMDGVMGPQTRDAIHKVPSWDNAQPVGGGYSALRWQQELAEHGWHIETDGAWGPHSDSILRQFQADKHIDVNGQRNYQTWAALHTQPN